MWTIKDHVVGEIVNTSTKEQAIKIAEKRIQYHNSEFNYSHRGKHYSAGATYTIDETKKEIVIKGG